MPEVRVDALTGLRTIFAPERLERPGALTVPPPVTAPDPADDPFAPGNEAQTPPELQAVRDASGAWLARAFANKHPALVPDAVAPDREAKLDLFTSLAAVGAHEVIVNAPGPVTRLADLTGEQLALAMGLWRERMRAQDGAALVHVHVNEGIEGGASLPHTHAQLLALDFVPALVARERERCSAYAGRTMGSNLLADLLQEEVRMRVRLIGVDPEAVLLAAYAGRTPYAFTLVPRRTSAHFEDDGPLGAALLSRGLRALEHRFGGPVPLTLWVRTAPRGAEHFCWRVDVAPRLTGVAGLELGTGVHLNPVMPERAAAELREALPA